MSTAATSLVRATPVLPPSRLLAEPEPAVPTCPTQGELMPEVLRRAESLEIPWERILLEEINAEQKLRSHLADVDTDCPLWSVLTILPFSLLQSWRARDQIQGLACEARGASARDAIRDLRRVFERLTGKASRDQVSFAEHLWFAYQRVLLLQRVSRAAERSSGTTTERVAFVCLKTRCSYDDAAWAVCQEYSSRRGHRLDAAVGKVREEGFLIPRANTEARSFAVLRRIIRSSAHPNRRRRAPRGSQDPVSAPRRLAHAVDAI